MNSSTWIAIYMPLFILFFVIIPHQREIERAVQLKSKKRKGVKTMTNEIIKKYKCKSRFKLEGDYLNDLEGDIFCPICGISSGLSYFYPEEVAQAAMEIAQAYAEEMIYNAFNTIN